MISLRNLTKAYDNVAVVDNLSLEIPAGSVFGFLGLNGAGKTTTMKMLVGLIQPDGGEARIDGQIMGLAVREDIGFMPENPAFYENLTAFEFLNFCGELFKFIPPDSRDKWNEKLLGQVGLGGVGVKRIRGYSKGMKQRLGFAQAMVNDPKYIFLDEPLDGLDPLGRREIKAIIGQMKSAGKTVFLNSHILSDIEEICDAIGIIHEGKLLYNGLVNDFCRGMSLEERFVENIRSSK